MAAGLQHRTVQALVRLPHDQRPAQGNFARRQAPKRKYIYASELGASAAHRLKPMFTKQALWSWSRTATKKLPDGVQMQLARVALGMPTYAAKEPGNHHVVTKVQAEMC